MNLELIKKEAANFNYTNAGFEADLVAFAKHCVEKSQQWRPIEEAPKDHYARLYLVDWVCVTGFLDVTATLFVQMEKREYRKMRGKPTHWQPLPPAPEAA
jgi:hypothetical protein